ncbi:MAG: type II secretion system F family protein [Proteobacteria bacterium]|nr:type II secretion system F family protein [Pseudomonadota bacterium]
MPSFAYVALDAQGQQVSDYIDAASQSEAVTQLRGRGLFPTSVKEQARSAKSKGAAKGGAAKSKDLKINIPFLEKKTIKSKTLMIFTRQLATLIDAGLPLLRGLTVLGKQEPDPVLKKTITQLAEAVQGGGTFSDGLTGHPKIFNKLYVNMVKAGELGGVLEVVLNRLAEFQEKAQKVKGKVQSAMMYPAIVMVIAIIIMGSLLVFIVPKFEQIFADMLGGKPLPLLTQIVVGASRGIQQNILFIIGGVIGIVFGLKWFASTPKGSVLLDQFMLKAPLFGDLTRKNAISRFTRTLGTLVTSGVPILQALNITKETAGNAVISTAISKIHDAVKEGESIVRPMDASGVFPAMVISMVDVGEETGQLPEMLLKVADLYDDEVDNAVAGLTSLMEPIMIVFLAVVVGSIVIALFLPLIGIISGMQQ